VAVETAMDTVFMVELLKGVPRRGRDWSPTIS